MLLKPAESRWGMKREMQTLLEEHGVGAEIEKVPPTTKEEAHHPKWNLYAPAGQVEVTHINLNDRSLEGMRHRRLPIFSVQYHPEASAGPHDAAYLFDEFIALMERYTKE